MSERYEADALKAELDRWGEAEREARLWLRDDDAVEPTPALDRLLGLIRDHDVPCLLAVIPTLATEALAERVAGEPLLRAAMHGISHANHAPAGRKSEETPAERGLDRIRDELSIARTRLLSLFGEAAGRWYVPPWNRIGREAAALLPMIGFRAISAFGSQPLAASPALAELNTHVDLMDWKGGRIGRAFPAVAADLARELALARTEGFRPVGLLAHHLAHDAEAWRTLDAVLRLVERHRGARWHAADDLLAEPATETL